MGGLFCGKAITLLIRLVHVFVPAVRQELNGLAFFQMEGLIGDLYAEDTFSTDDVFANSRIVAFRNTL